MNLCHNDVRYRAFRIQSLREYCSLASSLECDPRRQPTNFTEKSMGLRKAICCRRKRRIQRQRLLELSNGSLSALLRVAIKRLQAAQISVEGLRRLDRSTRGGVSFYRNLQCAREFGLTGVLHLEHVDHVRIETVRPTFRTRLRLYQLRRNENAPVLSA